MTGRVLGSVTVTPDSIVVGQFVQTAFQLGFDSTRSFDGPIGNHGVGFYRIGHRMPHVVSMSIRLRGVEDVLGILEMTAVVLAVSAFRVV